MQRGSIKLNRNSWKQASTDKRENGEKSTVAKSLCSPVSETEDAFTRCMYAGHETKKGFQTIRGSIHPRCSALHFVAP